MKQTVQTYGKNRQWWAVLYPENMLPDWKDRIEDVVQLPFAYCVHDKGLQLEELDEERKQHVHLILVWPAPTTYKHAMEVFDGLSAPGRKALSSCKPVYWAQRAYNYLIHDTDDCRKKGKYQFRPEERITGNNYDIGDYIQISLEEKNEMFDALTAFILDNNIRNFADFVEYSAKAFADKKEILREVVRGHSSYFERLVKGCYHRVTANTVDASKLDAAAAPYQGEWGPDLLDDDGHLADASDVWGQKSDGSHHIFP